MIKEEVRAFPIDDKIEKILILRTGSVNHTLKVIDELKSRFPSSTISLLTQWDAKRIFEENSKADEVITCNKAGDYSFQITYGFLRKLRKPSYDMTVMLYRTEQSNRDIRADFLSSIIRSKYRLANNFRYEWINLAVHSQAVSIMLSFIRFFSASLKYFLRPFSKIIGKFLYEIPIFVFNHILFYLRKSLISVKSRIIPSEKNSTGISSYNIEYKETLRTFKKIRKDKGKDLGFSDLYNLAMNLIDYHQYESAIDIFTIIEDRFPAKDYLTTCSMNYYKALSYYHMRRHNYAEVALKKATDAIFNEDDPVINSSWNTKIEKLSSDNTYQKLNFPQGPMRKIFSIKDDYNFWTDLNARIRIFLSSKEKRKFGSSFTRKEGYKESNRKLNDREYKEMKSYLASNPVGLSICLTGRCNLRCGKCVRNTPLAVKQISIWEKDLSSENLEKIRTFFPGLFGVRLTSAFGEPLLYPGFKDIVKELYDYGVRVGTFNTNAILLNKDISDFLVKNPMVDCFAVSLDAATEETFRKLQGKPFKRVIENVKYYMSISNNYPNLNLYFIVSKSNLNEICDYIKMAHELGVKNVLMDYMNYGREYFKINIPMGDGYTFNYKDEFVGNMNHSLIQKEAIKLGEEFGIQLMGNFFHEYYTEQETSKEDIPLCSLPWRNLSIETDGGVRNCCWQNENLTNINECETIDQLWNNEKQMRVRKRIKNNMLDDICYSNTCPVVSSGAKINWLFQ